jgi:hypothetical protein
MAYFSDKVSLLNLIGLKGLDGWIRAYATDGLRGEELEPGPIELDSSARPTIRHVVGVKEIVVPEAEHLGDGVIEARCQVSLVLELDLNVDEGNTVSREATLDITLQVNSLEEKITAHSLHDARACQSPGRPAGHSPIEPGGSPTARPRKTSTSSPRTDR